MGRRQRTRHTELGGWAEGSLVGIFSYNASIISSSEQLTKGRRRWTEAPRERGEEALELGKGC